MSDKHIHRSKWICLWLLCASFFFAEAAAAEAKTKVPDHAIKASFLARLIDFVEWPSAVAGRVSSKVQICVVGQDRFGPYLNAIATDEGESPAIQVKRVSSIARADGCDIIFFAQREAARIGSYGSRLCNRPVLTVSDSPKFLDSGGMISFITARGRLEIHINQSAVKRAGFKVSPYLLEIAQLKGREMKCPAAPKRSRASDQDPLFRRVNR